ncbi:MAG: dual specificity protein phosphatase family protein [Gemmataceae bacterium]|nr:dual specificity protein phosphatase family protein [Gemmataceae bacterium]
MRNALRWAGAVAVVAVVAGPPAALFRAQYAHAKRLREVTPGKLYRSGQMTAAGFRQTVDRYGIKTVINLQHESPDPVLPENWLGKKGVRESELCEQLGVRYVLLTPDILPQPNDLAKMPPVVDEFLKVLDDPAAYPVLLHCKAGLHRTGRLTAIYRMEYEGWSVGEALREMRANGYGYGVAGEGDVFVVQFLGSYVPRAQPAGGKRP